MATSPHLTPHARDRWYERAPSDATEPWQALANATPVDGLESHDAFRHGQKQPDVVYGYGATTASGEEYWMVFIQVAKGHEFDAPTIVTTYPPAPSVCDRVREAVRRDGGVVDESAYCTLTNSPSIHTDV